MMHFLMICRNITEIENFCFRKFCSEVLRWNLRSFKFIKLFILLKEFSKSSLDEVLKKSWRISKEIHKRILMKYLIECQILEVFQKQILHEPPRGCIWVFI